MNLGKLVFSQLMAHLPLTTFRRCVARYRGHFKVKSFSCRDHFLCMAFAQLTYRESLRDIEACLRAQSAKLYHLGFRSAVSRSTLADANESRDWRIYADFAQQPDRHRPPALRRRPLRRRARRTPSTRSIPPPSICACRCSPGRRFDHQGGRQAAHAARPARQHPLVSSSSATARCTTSTSSTSSCPKPARSTSWIAATSTSSACRACTRQAASSSPAPRRTSRLRRRYSAPVDRTTGLRLRPDGRADGLLLAQGLSASRCGASVRRSASRASGWSS